MRRSSSVLLSAFSLLLAGAPVLGRAWAGDPVPATTEAPATPAPLSAEANAAAEQEALSAVNRELLTSEEQVDQTKERVFRAKATLQLLREIVIEGSSNGGRLVIQHVNKLAGGFVLESVLYTLDGQNKLAKADASGALNQNREIQVSDGMVASGKHTLAVEFKVRPTGFGVFKYAQNYTIDVRDTYPFTVELGKGCTLRATISEKGGAVDRLEERAKVSYDLKCEIIDGN